LQNYGRIRQCELHVGIGYESDLSVALGIIRNLVQTNSRVLVEPAPVIQVINLADSAIVVAVKPWVAVNDFVTAAGELNQSLVEELQRRNISIPFPQREVRLVKDAA
jgi:small conductance mechanosensitive channel